VVPTTRGGIEMMEIDINENEQVTSVCALVRRFAHEVISRQKQYRDDLLVACLQFIISLPSECIDYDFEDYVPTIQVGNDTVSFWFEIKRMDLYVLACLEYWFNLFTISGTDD